MDETDAVQAQPAASRPYLHPVIHWLNDVSDTTSGSPYHGWQSSVSGLLRPTWQLHPIAANLYSAIFAGDLSEEGSLRSLAMAGYLIQVCILSMIE